MIEVERNQEWATKGVAGTALGLGAGALGLELLRGNLGGILGGGNSCGENGHLVNRYEAQQSARIAELETEVKLRDANVYTMTEMGKLRDYVDTRVGRLEHELCDQKVFNATQIATIGCIQNQVNQLMGLTKVVVPNSSICPGWTTTTT